MFLRCAQFVGVCRAQALAKPIMFRVAFCLIEYWNLSAVNECPAPLYLCHILVDNHELRGTGIRGQDKILKRTAGSEKLRRAGFRVRTD